MARSLECKRDACGCASGHGDEMDKRNGAEESLGVARGQFAGLMDRRPSTTAPHSLASSTLYHHPSYRYHHVLCVASFQLLTLLSLL